MTESVFHWRVFCEDGHGVQHVWSPTQPTVCPLNAAHTLTSSLTSAVHEISRNIVKVEEESTKTQGIYQWVGKHVTIPAGTPGAVTTIDWVWPDFPVTVLNGQFDVNDAQIGDTINFNVAPDAVIGVITAPTNGTTTLQVSPTVIQNIYIGYQVALFDGVQLERLGICTDKGAGTITVKTAPALSFAAMSYLMISVEVVKDVKVNADQQRYTFAKKKMGGKAIPAGTILRVLYTNANGVEKQFNASLEIMY